MKKVGFYLAPSQPVERVLPLIARAARNAGEKLLVVTDDADLRARLDTALWEYAPEAFLAHGDAAEPHAERQPILLSDTCEAPNGARMIAFADGKWRDEADGFDRAFLFFDDTGRDAARAVWREFDSRDDVEREFHELEGGKWLKRL